jgi:putative transposase
VGFLDETSPQTTSNTQRLLSFEKPIIYKNTTKYKANAFGFYPLNGVPVIDFKEHSRKEMYAIFSGISVKAILKKRSF